MALVCKPKFEASVSTLPGNLAGGGTFAGMLDPESTCSLSTPTDQQKGGFADVLAAEPFPFPYADDFESYTDPKSRGRLPKYTADIAGAFELANRPDGQGRCLRQAVPVPNHGSDR